MPDLQITLMNIRAIAAICPEEDRWPLAGPTPAAPRSSSGSDSRR